MKSQVEIMHEAGFVTASEAAELLGATHLGTIHRMVKKNALVGERVGTHWYVHATSLLQSVRGSLTMRGRVESFMKSNGIPLKPVFTDSPKETTRGKGKRAAAR